MFNVFKQEIEWGGRPLVIETGKVARQSDGAVMISYGDTTMLCTVVGAKSAKPDQDFFPLTVHYQEKAFAAGKIPGGYVKREGKPSEKEVLTSRLIDRPIRPLFPEDFKNEVQVICTLLSFDMQNSTEALAIIGASAALRLSGIPLLETVGAARIGYKDGKFILNPTVEEIKSGSDLDLVVAGTEKGVLMVESEAKELSEQIMLDAVTFAHTSFQPVIQMIEKLAKQAAKPRWETADYTAQNTEVFTALKKAAEADVRAAYKILNKAERYSKVNAIRDAMMAEFVDETSDVFTPSRVQSQFKKLEQDVVRGDLLKTKTRIDGRDLETVRPIICEVNVLPRVHGSALFTRGETQALVVATLGTGQDEQVVDSLEGEYRKKFMLDYNFPPYSVGEAGRMTGPGRREIGHGKLAWRAINPMLPSKEESPYTVRVVAEITECNGSSSMATVCGASLALMDAGVAMKAPVAGIAMGLIKEGDDFAVLSDILGDEDHLGDMDFKVAGTANGITSLQMDIKVTSITPAIMQQALLQANGGRLHILGKMAEAITTPRANVNEFAPKMVTIQINKEKIRDLIGPGGKVIREICETANVKIDISEEGEVKIAGVNSADIDKATAMVTAIVVDPEVGMVVEGTVSKLMDFGAIVSFMGEKTGLVHISQLSQERVANVEDVVKPGDKVWVKILEVDDRGKVRLSMKVLNQESGAAIEA
jgi:polyribonucleotide nucleotidyltransferase